MEDFREIIREIISEVFLPEASPDSHFHDRVLGRLESLRYTSPQFPDTFLNGVKKQIELLKKVNFNPNESWAVFLNRYPVVFKSKDPEFPGEVDKISQGTDLWILIRDNELRTIMFRRQPQAKKPIPGIQYKTTLKTLQKFYDAKEKDENGNISFSNADLQGSQKKKEGGRRKSLDLPLIELGDTVWYIDKDNSRLMNKKNIKKSITLDQAFEMFSEEELDKLLALF